MEPAQSAEPKTFRHTPSVPGLKMAQNGSKWLKMAQNGSKWLKMAQNGSKWLNLCSVVAEGYFFETKLMVYDVI